VETLNPAQSINQSINQPVCLNNNALSLSNFRHQLKHFYFSS